MSEKIDGMSMNIEATNLEKLKSLFPECVSEGKLDIDKLLSLCGEYIDNDFEKYKFEWKGKAECLRLAQKRSSGTLRPCESESAGKDGTHGKFDSDNLYIEGDNLEVLKLLQTAYYRRVKMIYIDPPYNTGNDFVYEDDFADPINRYKEVTSQTTKSNPETMGRYHTNWLNMMYPRLRLAANLLRDDGVIFISIDDNEVDNLKKLCNEVFGEENQIGTFVWQKKYGPANDAKGVSATHEFVFGYAKNEENWMPALIGRNEEQLKAFKNPDNDPRGLWRASDLSARTYSKNCDYPITGPTNMVFYPPKSRSWIVSKARYNELLADNRITFGVNGDCRPMQKKFLSEVKSGITPDTWLNRDKAGDNKTARYEIKALFPENVFDTPKPTKLISLLMPIANVTDNDIILDFFSGSATTAHAVMQLNAEDGGNRKFIMVQLPEVCDENSEAYKAGYKNICEIGKERIRRAGAKILNECGVRSVECGVEDKNNYECGVRNVECGNECGVLSEECGIVDDNNNSTLQTPNSKLLKECGVVDKNNNSTLQTPNSTLDIGFKVFKLDTSNLVMWDSAPIENHDIMTLLNRLNAMTSSVKPDRTDMDVVAEIMLKMGVPLDIPVTKIDVNGKAAYAVGDYLLLICLAENVTAEDMEKLCDLAPGKLVIAESSFADTSAMRNANYIVRDRSVSLKLI